MSEENFADLVDNYSKTVHSGEIVEGEVIDVTPDQIVLNIHSKSDGIITKNEYSNDSSVDLTEVVKVGDTMEAKVIKVNDGEGQTLLTYKRLAAEKGNKRLAEAFENHEILKAPVVQVPNGGLVAVGGVLIAHAGRQVEASADLLIDQDQIQPGQFYNVNDHEQNRNCR